MVEEGFDPDFDFDPDSDLAGVVWVVAADWAEVEVEAGVVDWGWVAAT